MSSRLEELGKLLHRQGLAQFDRCGLNTKLSTSEEIFERFVMGLLDGMVRTDILERAKPQLFRIFNEQRARELYEASSPQEFREEVFRIFRSVRISGLFRWETMASGIMEIVKLARQSDGLNNLYPSLLEEMGNSKLARHGLLTAILNIPGISDKKALVLLRDLHYQCDWGYPIDDLPMPVDTHVKIVLKRMGYIRGVKGSQTDLEIQSAALSYFDVPLMVDLAVWDIGKRFCHKRGVPKCTQGCPASEYCEHSALHYSR